MSTPIIQDFQFDADNLDKLATHRLSDWQVAEILDNEHVVVPNRKRRRAKYLVIGLDNAGNCLTVPVAPTSDRGVWRPVTAWRCKDSERAKLQR